MKRHIIAAACASLFAVSAFAQQTAPLNPNTATPGSYLTYYIAGASAQGSAVTSVISGNNSQGTSAIFETPSQVVTITQSCPALSGTQTLYNANCDKVTMWYGLSKANGAVAAGTPVLVIYNNADGSFAGMNQLANLGGLTDAEADYANLVDNGDGSYQLGSALGMFHGVVPVLGNGLILSGSGLSYTTSEQAWVNGAPNPHFGFVRADLALADVHNTESVPGAYAPGTTPYNTQMQTASNIKTATTGLETFGVAVNPALYAALQIAQGLATSSTTSASSLDLNPAHIPNITSEEYASLISTAGATKTAAEFLSFFQPGNTDPNVITIERRINLSGTQASSGIHFLNTPCATGFGGGGLTPTSLEAGNNTSLYGIVENSATGDVQAQLKTGSDYRIGVISLEKNQALGQNTYNFIKLDGVSPNYSAFAAGGTATAPVYDAQGRINTSVGQYKYAVEMSANWDKTDTASNSLAVFESAIVSALSNSTLHDIVGVSYLDGATDGTDFKQARYAHNGNNCSPAAATATLYKSGLTQEAAQ